jgi:hypothetical protein
VHALHDRIGNPGMRVAGEGYRAIVLVALGRLDAAESVLGAAEKTGESIPADLLRFREEARAELAWQRGRAELAVAAAARGLDAWPSDSSVDLDQRARLALLRQRASIAAGQPTAADIAALEAAGDEGSSAYREVAAAEWAAYQKKDAGAERLFRQAAAAAESKGVPDAIVVAANAEARWLLAHDRATEAAALAGRIAVWADQDFDSALLQVAAFQATGPFDAWKRALLRAQRLAGERAIPTELSTPPVSH